MKGTFNYVIGKNNLCTFVSTFFVSDIIDFSMISWYDDITLGKGHGKTVVDILSQFLSIKFTLIFKEVRKFHFHIVCLPCLKHFVNLAEVKDFGILLKISNYRHQINSREKLTRLFLDFTCHNNYSSHISTKSIQPFNSSHFTAMMQVWCCFSHPSANEIIKKSFSQHMQGCQDS